MTLASKPSYMLFEIIHTNAFVRDALRKITSLEEREIDYALWYYVADHLVGAGVIVAHYTSKPEYERLIPVIRALTNYSSEEIMPHITHLRGGEAVTLTITTDLVTIARH